MRYIARAFVEVQQDKIPQIIKHLTKIGLDNRVEKTVNLYGYIVIWNGKFATLPSDEKERVENFIHYINCNFYANGDEEKAIELFLELAKMRDDIRINQWFYYISDSNNKKVFVKVCGLEDRNNDSMFIESQIQSKNLIRLSQLELAEAFKQGKINLK